MTTEAVGVENNSESEPTIDIGVDGTEIPISSVLMGRGFLTGKSGSGKSNTTNVVLEELFSAGFPAFVVDTDGEYWPLADEFDALHAGSGIGCDYEVTPDNADQLASVALRERAPVILDVSEYDDERQIIKAVAEALFIQQRREQTPYLFVLEEAHEYIPEKGRDDLSDILIRIAKRGRKRGLGILALSQRPASIRKDFITQCNWVCWHTLTWSNDVDAAADAIGREAADELADFQPGEAHFTADWLDGLNRVQIRRQHTHDAGAAPPLEVGRPLAKSANVLEEIGPDDDPEPETDGDTEPVVNVNSDEYHDLTGYDEHARATYHALRSIGVGKFSDVHDAYLDYVDEPASEMTVRRRLGTLRDDGLLEKNGEYVGTRHYHLPPVDADVVALSETIRSANDLSDLHDHLGEIAQVAAYYHGVRTSPDCEDRTDVEYTLPSGGDR